jgi:hypothetical protein
MGQRTLNIWMGGVTLLGVLLAVGSLAGRRVVREIVPVLSGPSRTMELRTRGSRSAGSPTIIRVLATLDDVGSRNRTPKIEFKAIWHTPGIAEAPGSDARVYGVGEAEGRGSVRHRGSRHGHGEAGGSSVRGSPSRSAGVKFILGRRDHVG